MRQSVGQNVVVRVEATFCQTFPILKKIIWPTLESSVLATFYIFFRWSKINLFFRKLKLAYTLATALWRILSVESWAQIGQNLYFKKTWKPISILMPSFILTNGCGINVLIFKKNLFYLFYFLHFNFIYFHVKE